MACRNEYMVRASARVAVGQAIKHGRLPPATACVCCGAAQGLTKGGRPSVIYHHDRGYLGANRTEVVAVCRRCHSEIHRGLRAEPRAEFPK